MLPFDSPRSLPTVQISDIAIPKYGCLLVNEAIAVDELISSSGIHELLQLSIESGSAARTIKAALTTILLLYRDSPRWQLQEVLLLDDADLEAASDFLLGERTRWQEPQAEAEAESPKHKPIEWNELFWRVQHLYPNEPRFNAANFGSCPIVLIEEALAIASQRELEAASIAATPIALMAVHMMSMQGVKNPKLEWINPYQTTLAEQSAKSSIEPAIARTFLQLTSAGEVPGWVLDVVDVEQIRLAAK